MELFGFRLLDELTYDECTLHLERAKKLGRKPNPDIKKRQGELATALAVKDKEVFNNCKSVEDYIKYIEKEVAPGATMYPHGYIDEANRAISNLRRKEQLSGLGFDICAKEVERQRSTGNTTVERLLALRYNALITELTELDNKKFNESKSISKLRSYINEPLREDAKDFPKQHLQEAEDKIKKKKRKFFRGLTFILAGIVLSVIVISGFATYSDADVYITAYEKVYGKESEMTISDNNVLEIPASGGEFILRFRCNNKYYSDDEINQLIKSCEKSWFKRNVSDDYWGEKFSVTIPENPDEERETSITLESFHEIYEFKFSPITETLTIRQESGKATYLSADNVHLRFDWNGKPLPLYSSDPQPREDYHKVGISTDAVSSSLEDDHDAYHYKVIRESSYKGPDDKYTYHVKVYENNDYSKKFYEFTIKSGDCSAKIKIEQEAKPRPVDYEEGVKGY